MSVVEEEGRSFVLLLKRMETERPNSQQSNKWTVAYLPPIQHEINPGRKEQGIASAALCMMDQMPMYVVEEEGQNFVFILEAVSLKRGKTIFCLSVI